MYGVFSNKIGNLLKVERKCRQFCYQSRLIIEFCLDLLYLPANIIIFSKMNNSLRNSNNLTILILKCTLETPYTLKIVNQVYTKS